jgi:hypothetical protein
VGSGFRETNMNAGHMNAKEVLAKQLQRQLQIDRVRGTWWIPWLFVIGFCISALGLFVAVASYLDGRPKWLMLILFGFFFLQFALAVVLWLTSPLRVKPRIVPCFARKLGDYGGANSAAFNRGRALYLEIDMLERLAETLGIAPLSVFGFADDYYQQAVRWHTADEGVRSVAALRQGLASQAESDLARDLAALDGALRIAAEQGIEFCLVLRRLRKDSRQVAESMEERSGRFW